MRSSSATSGIVAIDLGKQQRDRNANRQQGESAIGQGRQDRKSNAREATTGQLTTEPATENRQGKQRRGRIGNREGKRRVPLAFRQCGSAWGRSIRPGIQEGQREGAGSRVPACFSPAPVPLPAALWATVENGKTAPMGCTTASSISIIDKLRSSGKRTRTRRSTREPRPAGQRGCRHGEQPG
jgi:hypothetical protein